MIANVPELIGTFMIIGFVVWILIAIYEGGKRDAKNQ